MLANEAGTFSRSELQAKIEARFGIDAIFGTCSMSDLNTADIIEVLIRKGKVVGTDDALRFAAPSHHECGCQH